MVLTGLLKIKGHRQEEEGIPILSCSYGFMQDVDPRGMTQSEVKGGIITFNFYSFDDQEIMTWMLTPDMDKDGKIEFSDEADGKAYKTVEFADARCISYKESFVRDGMLGTELVISAREIKISDVVHRNPWTKYKF